MTESLARRVYGCWHAAVKWLHCAVLAGRGRFRGPSTASHATRRKEVPPTQPAGFTPARPPGPGVSPAAPPAGAHPAPFTAIPSAVLVHQAALGLTPRHVCLIARLCSFQRDRRLPYPSVATLARRMGLSRAQVHRHLQEPARAGLLVQPRRRPDGGATSNACELAPLWQRAQALATAAAAPSPAARPPAAAPRAQEPPAPACPAPGPGSAPAPGYAGPPRAQETAPVAALRQETPASNQLQEKHHCAARQHSATGLHTAAARPGPPAPAGGAPVRCPGGGRRAGPGRGPARRRPCRGGAPGVPAGAAPAWRGASRARAWRNALAWRARGGPGHGTPPVRASPGSRPRRSRAHPGPGPPKPPSTGEHLGRRRPVRACARRWSRGG